MMLKRELIIIFAPIWLFTFACSSSTKNYIETDRRWDPYLNNYFDNSIDFLLNPEELSGEWKKQYIEELKGRVKYSDFIGVIKITSIREDVTPDGKEYKRIYGEVLKTYKLNQDTIKTLNELELMAYQDIASFEIIEENIRRLLNNAFIAYITWYKDEVDNTIKNHWHLSPATKSVISLTKRTIEEVLIKKLTNKMK